MALLLIPGELQPLPVFIHVQKTGGSWARKTMAEMGLVKKEVGGTHRQLQPLRDKLPDAWVFGFTRDPYDFLKSYFLHRNRTGAWHPNRDLDTICRSETLAGFLNAYLVHLPGWVGRWFDLYLEGADFVGRYDCLREDLCSALGAAGLPFDLDQVMSSPPFHVTPPVGEAVLGLRGREDFYREAVLLAEAEACTKWGY